MGRRLRISLGLVLIIMMIQRTGDFGREVHEDLWESVWKEGGGECVRLEITEVDGSGLG